MRKPSASAFSNVDNTGENNAAWANATRSAALGVLIADAAKCVGMLTGGRLGNHVDVRCHNLVDSE